MDRRIECGRSRLDQPANSAACNFDAERAVLACVLLAPERFVDVAKVLKASDFAENANRMIFGAMLRLRRRGLPPEITLVIAELQKARQYNTNPGVSAVTLANLFQDLPLVRDLDYYLACVVETSRRRQDLLKPV